MDFFSEKIDETGAEWRRLPMEKLPDCARCYVEYVGKYGHFIIGRNKNRWFIGIPGRFLQEEKPGGGYFTLWQPIRGGELFYESLESISEDMQNRIFGYWICGICPKGRRLKKY